jgi:putative cell wall-binding protein
MAVLRRRVLAPVVLLGMALALVLPSLPARASGTLAWPHFIKVHVVNRRADTRVVVDAGYANVRWVSQPGVNAGDYLVRVDQSGFIRSLDDKLAFWRQGPAQAGGLVVRIQSPGTDGTDSFPFDPGTQPLTPGQPSYAAGTGNAVDDVQPYIPTFTLPMDFEINVAGQCRANQYLQVAGEWTNSVWRTPDGIGPGLYKVRMNPDFSVVSLDGKATFSHIAAQPWDFGHQVLGVLIVHSCDPAGDGADIVGYGRNSDGSFQHMTTWSQTPDGGYGWQPYNCGQTGVCSSQPRESLYGGNYIVQDRPAPLPPPLDFSPTRLNAASWPSVSVAASQAQFAAGSANQAVLARWDQFADALAGVPLALAKRGPLLLCSTIGVEAEVVNELRRVVKPGGTVYLLGGTNALSDNVLATIAQWGFRPVRLAGADRVGTAVAIAGAIGPASTAFVVNAWNFPDALAAGAAAGAVPGGAHVLLTNPDSVPAATAAQLSAGGYTSRIVFGGTAVVNSATYAALGAGERVAGADRDATAAAAARRFFANASTVWVAAGTDFVGGITGGAMAARQGGPLLLATGGLGDATRSYLKDVQPGSGFVMGALDDGIVREIFGQSAH